MVRMQLLLTFALLGALVAPGFAGNPPADLTGSASEDPLPGLPRPLDVPRSLMLPESPPSPVGLEAPYFESDPLLDPPEMPQPGWFAAVDANVLAPHFKNRLTETLNIGPAGASSIHAAGAALDWTVSPSIESGYRLESGFGAVALSYRFLASRGSSLGQGADGPAMLNSRLDLNQGDLDYLSNEFSLWPSWEMKWRAGARAAVVYYDAQEHQSVAAAAAGSGLVDQRNTNCFAGGGFHAGFELVRHLEDSGWAFIVRTDSAAMMGQLRQGFFARSTVAGPDGSFTAQLHDTGIQGVPSLAGALGLSWQPPRSNGVEVFAGYQYEYWWNIGRQSSTLSRGELGSQGIVVRASINY